LPIDYKWYLEKQIKEPLLRIFEPIFGEKAEAILLQGDHTRHIVVPSKGATTSGIFKFAVVQKTCLGCKNLLKPKQDVVCDNCETKMKQIYIERKQELKLFEKQYCDLWVQC
jgi:DNA polymerase delta subunit 1